MVAAQRKMAGRSTRAAPGRRPGAVIDAFGQPSKRPHVERRGAALSERTDDLNLVDERDGRDRRIFNSAANLGIRSRSTIWILLSAVSPIVQPAECEAFQNRRQRPLEVGQRGVAFWIVFDRDAEHSRINGFLAADDPFVERRTLPAFWVSRRPASKSLGLLRRLWRRATPVYRP